MQERQEIEERKLKMCIFQYQFSVHTQHVFLTYDLDHKYLAACAVQDFCSECMYQL
jgi:hypothetical protein